MIHYLWCHRALQQGPSWQPNLEPRRHDVVATVPQEIKVDWPSIFRWTSRVFRKHWQPMVVVCGLWISTILSDEQLKLKLKNKIKQKHIEHIYWRLKHIQNHDQPWSTTCFPHYLLQLRSRCSARNLGVPAAYKGSTEALSLGEFGRCMCLWKYVMYATYVNAHSITRLYTCHPCAYAFSNFNKPCTLISLQCTSHQRMQNPARLLSMPPSRDVDRPMGEPNRPWSPSNIYPSLGRAGPNFTTIQQKLGLTVFTAYILPTCNLNPATLSI